MSFVPGDATYFVHDYQDIIIDAQNQNPQATHDSIMFTIPNVNLWIISRGYDVEIRYREVTRNPISNPKYGKIVLKDALMEYNTRAFDIINGALTYKLEISDRTYSIDYMPTIKTLGIFVPEDKNILQLEIHDHSCPQHWLIPQADKVRDLAFYRQESKLILELKGIQKFVVMNNFYHNEARVYSPIHESSEIRLKNEIMSSSYFHHAISHAQLIDDHI